MSFFFAYKELFKNYYKEDIKILDSSQFYIIVDNSENSLSYY